MSEDAVALKIKIKALIVFRAVFITLLAGSFHLFIEYEKSQYVQALYYLTVTLYILTVIYSLLLVKIRNLVAFAYTQLVLDVIFEIILIYTTGGIDSWFSFTLILTVISSIIILNKKAGYIIATCSSILYGILVNLQFHQVLPMTSDIVTEEKEYLYKLFVHIISFYLTAYLSGYLSSRLEKTVQKLEEKDIDLRDLEVFNREVVESLPSGIFTTDIKGNVLIFNRTAEKITGIKKDSIIGRSIDLLIPYFKFPFFEGRKEDIIVVKGVQKIIGLGISTLKGADESPKGYIGIFQDLTQIKKLKAGMKQKEKMAAIGELASNIAHEIRNPLASLKGSIEMLKEDSVSTNCKERLMDIALKEMERLNHIITDFLTYSHPTLPVFQTFDIREHLDETIELLQTIDHQKGHISFKKTYSSPLL